MSVTWDTGVTFTVEIAFGFAPLATPTWTDVSAYVNRVRLVLGKSTPLSRFEAGKGSITFDNQDGRFDPNNSSSPYDPDVILTVPIRIQVVYNTVTYDLFRGVVDGWPVTYSARGKRSTVTVPIVDDFQTLGGQSLSTKTYTATDTKTRIGEVLDDIGWPAGRRDLDAGLSQVASFDATTDTNALSHLQSVAAGEAGWLWMSPTGDVTFRNRVALAGGISPTVTFGPGGGESNYVSVIPAYDPKYLWNDVRVTRRGGTEQTVTDATSITNHTQRTLARATEQGDDNEALNTAEWLLASHKDTLVRVDGLVVNPQDDPTDLFPIVLGADFDTAWTVKIDPPGAGTNLDQDVVVVGVRHDITPSFWVSTFSTRRLPTIETNTYWILGTSALDTGTVLA